VFSAQGAATVIVTVEGALDCEPFDTTSEKVSEAVPQSSEGSGSRSLC